jgi:amidophosphoribosyltransferase
MKKEYFRDKCGVFGVYNHYESSNLTYLGLHALQHRGQESAGIVSSDGNTFYSHTSLGHVVDIFNEDILSKLKGHMAIGHVRYSTTGETIAQNAQPFMVNYFRGYLAIAHNGNLVNYEQLKNKLEEEGSIFQSTMDSEVIVHLIAKSHHSDIIARIKEALFLIKGAFSVVMLTENKLIGARDPFGFRPLCLGKLDDSYILSSETCAFDLIGAKYIREIKPGEIVIIDENGIKFDQIPSENKRHAYCVFEHIYFARPDSIVFNQTVYTFRKVLGNMLADEMPVDADIVVPIPDSGIAAAIGYSETSGIPYETALIRNHYIGRTFIEPKQSIRHFGVKLKLNAIKEIVRGKRVILIDDSIVRGTTSRKIVKLIREVGAKEVHMRISSPTTNYPCFYGIDTPTRTELIASSHSIDEIRKYITADSLAYLTLESLKKALGKESHNYCYACFNGDYPIRFPWMEKKLDQTIF